MELHKVVQVPRLEQGLSKGPRVLETRLNPWGSWGRMRTQPRQL